MSRVSPPIDTVRHGGFALSTLIPRGRKPDEVVRVSDNEVYAVYADIENGKVKYKQTFKAEGTGNKRNNLKEQIEKSTDEGKTWKVIYPFGE